MGKLFSKENLLTFVEGIMNNSLTEFLRAGYNGPRKLLLNAQEINSYELVELTLSEEDKVILLINEEHQMSVDDNLCKSFEEAATTLNKEIDFVWMNMNKNEIAPKLLDRFTGEMTSIYIKSDSSTVKFSPVSTENNLPNLLIKFIKQRKLYHK